MKIENPEYAKLDEVQIILSSFNGNSPVFLHFEKEKKVIKAGENFHVNLSAPVVGRLEDLLGRQG